MQMVIFRKGRLSSGLRLQGSFHCETIEGPCALIEAERRQRVTNRQWCTGDPDRCWCTDPFRSMGSLSFTTVPILQHASTFKDKKQQKRTMGTLMLQIFWKMSNQRGNDEDSLGVVMFLRLGEWVCMPSNKGGGLFFLSSLLRKTPEAVFALRQPLYSS